MCTNWLIPPDAAWERLSIWGPLPNRVTHRCPLKLLPSRNHDLRLHCEVLGAPVGVFATMGEQCCDLVPTSYGLGSLQLEGLCMD